MTVYIEYVLIDNLFIDYELLKATFLITGCSVKKGRLLFCAFLGALIALAYPLLEFNAVLVCLVKIFSGLLIVLLSNRFYSVKSFYINSIVFIFLTFALGGTLMGIFLIFDIDYSSEFSIAVLVFPASLLIKMLVSLVKFFYTRKTEENFTVDCTLVLRDKIINTRAFIDTGNSLTFDNKPITVINKKLALSVIGIEEMRYLQHVEYNTASGKSKMPIIKFDRISVSDGCVKREIKDAYVGIADTGLKRVLLSPWFLEVKNEDIIEVEKAN